MNRLALLALLLNACVARQSQRRHVPARPASPTDASYPLLAIGGNPAMTQTRGWTEDGLASWYGRRHHGRITANGETFDMRGMTAAHLTLRFGTLVRVTNLENGQSVDVRINDRGPYSDGRVIDLSWAAARQIDMLERGVVPVHIEVLAPAPP